MKVGSFHKKDASHPVGGQEFIGWRVALDADGRSYTDHDACR